MNEPAMVSGDGSGPSVRAGVETSRTRTFRKPRGQRGLDLVDVEVELVRPNAVEADVEDEVRVRRLASELDQRRLAGRPSRRRCSTFSNRVRPDLPLVDLHGADCRADLVELDEKDLAGPVLVEGDGFRGARVGVGDGARPCPSAPSASGPGRGSRARSPRSPRS